MINARQDTRLELTRTLNDFTDYFGDTTPVAYVTTRNRGKLLTIYRNVADIVNGPDGTDEINSNVDARVFFTPLAADKKETYTVQVTRKYIHIF